MAETTITTRPAPAKKQPARRQSTTGAKILIMAASLGITLGGWGVLAVGQIQDALASSLSNSASALPNGAAAQTNNVAPSTTLRQVSPSQVNPPLVQPRPFARTRSSR